MATSGQYDYAATATTIIDSALSKCGAKQEAEATNPEQFVDALKELNTLIKFIAGKEGRHLWRRDEVLVFLNSSQPRYLLGDLSTDAEWCLESVFTSTELNGAATTAATSLTVDSTSGLRAGDRLGLELTAGTRQWMSIISVDSATTLTVPSISGAASDNASVYTYTTNTSEVVKVETLVNGALNAAVTGIVVDSTTGMSTGDRLSYVATDDTTVFTKITTVTDGTNLVVPTTAKAIADNAVLKTFTTTVNQGSTLTKLNGAASANDETLTLDTTSGMAAGDVLSVVLTDVSLEWVAIEHVVSTTIVAIPPISGAASDNAVVTHYRLKQPRPLRILHARRRNDPAGNDIKVEIESQEEYRDQPSKTTNGTPVFITYKPSLTSGELEIWQPPSVVKMFLGLTVERPFENFDAGANNPDIPQEWINPLTWMLADEIEIEYRVLDQLRLEKLHQKAESAWKWVNDFDDDTGSVYFESEYETGYGS